MNILIIGGGFLGQLLHTLLPEARVLDWRAQPPAHLARAFGAQYLWEPVPNLPCQAFHVVTYVDGKPATPDSIKAYKLKVGKVQDGADWRSQFRAVMPGYTVTLPPARVEYGMRVQTVDLANQRVHLSTAITLPYDWLISTIPLPALMDLCALPKPSDPFEHRPIYAWTRPGPEGPQWEVNYVSDPGNPVYRTTLRAGEIHSESLIPVEAVTPVHRLIPGKIYRHSAVPLVRAQLQMQHVMTVGRYGAWDPEQLAHETYREIREWKERCGL